MQLANIRKAFVAVVSISTLGLAAACGGAPDPEPTQSSQQHLSYECTEEGCACSDLADCKQAVKDGKCKEIIVRFGNHYCS
jgi:hypothetical protein